MPLYHFTDTRNLSSIKEEGLLSWPILFSKNIKFYPGSSYDSRMRDKDIGYPNYIRLCKEPYHPMAFTAKSEGRIKNFIWLEIDKVVMNWGETRFSDMNALDKLASVGSDKSLFLDSDDKQAEVLVKNTLSTKWIKIPPFKKWQ